MHWFIALAEGGPLNLRPLDAEELGIPPDPRELGFVSNRCVFAMTETAAVQAAIDDALLELRDKGVEIPGSMPKPVVSEIGRATWLQRLRRKWRGFAFYPWAD